MISLGLSAAQQQQFHDLLCSHHILDVGIQIMDLDHNNISDISARILDGQRTLDAAAAITRSLDLDLLDPDGALHLDRDSPAEGALFADRMIRMIYTVISPDGSQVYRVPTFTGPITRLDRNGALIEVECMGKEVRGLQPAWTDRTFRKGIRITSAIRLILRELMGESEMSIPDLPRKLPKKVSVGGDKLPWQVAKRLARGMGYLLFYDGMGVARMKPMDTGTVFTFKQGKSILTEPEVGFDMETVINAVEVWGKVPKKGQRKRGKRRPHARRVARKGHQFSPRNLGTKVNGKIVPHYRPLEIEDDGTRTRKAAVRLAVAELKRGLLQSVQVSYDALTIPHLEELDVIRTETYTFSDRHRLVRTALGYTAAAPQTIGYVRNVRVGKRGARLRRKPSRPPGRKVA